jgi:lipopolysaccharide transport system ATP-binding protein
MTETVIHVEGLGKRYRIGERVRYMALRDVLARAVMAPFRRAPGGAPEHFWAVRDVSFQVKEGEVVGLIGRNGAGKTTLLKILARITRPTTGWAEVRGRIGSLLEVGTGFHPELTGRENVYLSGAILGMKKVEINRKFDEIVAFAEVDQFLDTALKHYSSGMQMRLAFAVAAHLEPEILLVDEVLAVGDLQFQKKCLGKMGDVARTGRTIVFVSHQMNQIRRLCQRVMWVDGGGIRLNGPTHETVCAYESAMSAGELKSTNRGNAASAKARFLRWEIVGPRGEQSNVLSTLGGVTLGIVIDVLKPISAAHHGIALYNNERQLIWGWAANNVDLPVGKHEFFYTFPMLPLRPGPYTWLVSLWEGDTQLDAWECWPEMIVSTENYQHPRDEWNGVLNMPFEFKIRETTGIAITDRAP